MTHILTVALPQIAVQISFSSENNASNSSYSQLTQKPLAPAGANVQLCPKTNLKLT